MQKASRVFVLDYGGTIIAKERFDIYHKQTLSAISGRRPLGETRSHVMSRRQGILEDKHYISS